MIEKLKREDLCKLGKQYGLSLTEGESDDDFRERLKIAIIGKSVPKEEVWGKLNQFFNQGRQLKKDEEYLDDQGAKHVVTEVFDPDSVNYRNGYIAETVSADGENHFIITNKFECENEMDEIISSLILF